LRAWRPADEVRQHRNNLSSSHKVNGNTSNNDHPVVVVEKGSRLAQKVIAQKTVKWQVVKDLNF
jgi:hypothetical protein